MASILAVNPNTISQVAEEIINGKVVAFPTETVYGLGANAFNNEAVKKIFTLKKRPFFNPLIIHFSSLEEVLFYFNLNPTELLLAKTFWPGPLTLVLHNFSPKAAQISDLCKGKVTSLAVRVPNNLIARQIIEKSKVPIAAPSANIANHLSPTKAYHVYLSFKEENLSIIDGGDSVLGLESTIIEVIKTNSINILRYGTLTYEEISSKLNLYVLNNFTKSISAPGMLKKHYSPNTPIRLNAVECLKNEALLAFGKIDLLKNPLLANASKILNLSIEANLQEAASNLFSMLWELDMQKYKSIAVMSIPNKGIGIAINERLKKAAAKNL